MMEGYSSLAPECSANMKHAKIHSDGLIQSLENKDYDQAEHELKTLVRIYELMRFPDRK